MQKKDKIYEGKTKIVWSVEDDASMAILENKTAITANDDPSLTREFESKAKSATMTTCRVFDLLTDAGIPVAHEKQLSDTEFLAARCTMIPLECIARRYAVGSYLQRFPHLVPAKEERNHRFHRLEMEFFLKTTGGRLRTIDGNDVDPRLPIDEKKGGPIDDPLILNPEYQLWRLSHPKRPLWDAAARIEKEVSAGDVLPEDVEIEQLEELTRRAFLVLERAWAMLGYKLIDYKIEFGVDERGNLCIADVIDNDSWRLWDADGKEVSKQLFRDGHPLAEVEDAYELVAALSQRFRIPEQKIVYWRGSEKDSGPGWNDPHPAGIYMEDIALSAHKSPMKCAAKLSEFEAFHPDGGVIVTAAGRSNGLGPFLAARTSWPVISTCPTVKEFPDDVWSSLRMPSGVPLMVATDPGNAYLAALNILAVSNPAAYATRQYAIEELDK